MRRIKPAFFALTLVLLLSACRNEPEKLNTFTPQPVIPSLTSAELKIRGKAAVGSGLTPEFLEKALEGAKEVDEADISKLTPVMLIFNYSDSTEDTYTLFIDVKNTAVWLADSKRCVCFSESDSADFLRDDAFDELYLSEPLGAKVMCSGREMQAGSYSIETKSGKTLSGSAQKGDIPVISVESAEDLRPAFSLEPESFDMTIVDREGAVPDEYPPGEYSCEIEAGYDGDGWSGTLRYEAVIRVVGKPDLLLSAGKVSQGEALLAVARNTVEGADYEIYLPHLNKTVPVYEAKGRYFALVQINITAKEGDYTLELRRLSDDGAYEKVASAGYTITAVQFTRQDLKTTSGTQSIYTPANLNSDNEKVEKAVSESRQAPYWRGVFLRPAEGEISTGFGQMRYVNNKLQSRHSGIDIAAAENSQVIAAAAGKVVFADKLIVNGNTVIIDHGLNVFTSYSHLNTISVKAGDIIKAGDFIGLVGSTGYSTGPHLHYTVMVNGYYISPFFAESEDLLADLVRLAG